MENTNRLTRRSDAADRPEDLSCWKRDERAQCLRVECNSDKQFLFPYGYLEQASFVSSDGEDTIELLFKNQKQTVSIKGRCLDEVWLAFQNLSVAWVTPLPPKFAPLTKGRACIKAISVEAVKAVAGDSEN